MSAKPTLSDDPYILATAYHAHRLRGGALNLAGWMTTYLKRRKQGLPSETAADQAIRGAVSLAGFLVWNDIEFEQRGWMAQAHDGAQAAWSIVQKMPEVLDKARRMGQDPPDFPIDDVVRLAAKHCSVANAKTWLDIAGSFPKWLDWPDDSEVLHRARDAWRRLHGVEDFPLSRPLPKVIHGDPAPATAAPPAVRGEPEEPETAGPAESPREERPAAADALGSKDGRLDEPPQKAIDAYRAVRFLGQKQAKVAERFGVTQGTISRWMTQVAEFVKAGNVLPDLEPPRKAVTMDPRKLEQGPRRR